MRRILERLLPLIVAAAVLAACGGGDSATEDDAGSHRDASPVPADARHVEVAARSFAFDPDEITGKAGEDIAILLKSQDSLHDFTIDDFGAHVPAEAGKTGFGGFRAGEPGRYPFYCSVAGHREAGMDGVLVVVDG